MIIYEVGVGKEYSVIQDAVDAIPYNLLTAYRIIVFDGEYPGFEVAGKIASNLNNITIENNNGSVVQINGNIRVSSQYVNISKLNIVGQVEFSLGSSNSKALHCIIKDNYNTAYLVEIEAGVRGIWIDSCNLRNGNNGILIGGDLDNRIYNNVIYNMNNYAVSTGEGIVNPYIINNTIVKNGTAIRYRGEQTVKIRNNNITHNMNGIVLENPSSPDLAIKSNNNVWNNSVNYIGTSGGTNARSFDPHYVNFTNNDFRVKPTSPCIDNGDPTDAPQNDYDGRERPKVSGYDIGAYEYSTENVAPITIINSITQRKDGSGYVDIQYVGFDENYDRCKLNLYEFSFNGAFTGEQKVMTIVSNDTLNDNINSLRFSFTGTTFNLVWDALTDLGAGFENIPVYIRLRANDGILNSNITVSNCTVDTLKPTINLFTIDRDTEIEEDVTISGIVNLSISVNGNVTSMKFSNDGVRWTHYEPYAEKKIGWNLISGYGGQAYQGLKKVYVKIKDVYGNETDGKLYDSTWYKLTEKSVENKRSGIKYHSIRAAIESTLDNDEIEIRTNETFYETFLINKNNISLIAVNGFFPSINMGSKNAINIKNVSGCYICGLSLYGANRESFKIEDSNNVVFEKNVFTGDYGILSLNSIDLKLNGNTFKGGVRAIELNGCINSSITNNKFVRMKDLVIELVNSPSSVINNHFISNGGCLFNEMPNNDRTIVRNNIFYGNELVIKANPLWIIEYNDFWINKIDFEGLVPRYEKAKNIVLDPLFLNYENDNFYLSSESPCINRGTKEGAPDKDFDGIKRKQDYGFDIGAFEYNPVPEELYNAANLLQRDDVIDFFIYDLSKDSIGKEWAKDYTKSWFLEKGEFPNLSYIVLTESGIDIIDVKNKSVYMRFTSGGNNILDGLEGYKCIFAMNGKIYVNRGKIGGIDCGLVCIDLINDKGYSFTTFEKSIYDGKIRDRNNSLGYVINNSNIKLIGDDVKSINGFLVNENEYIVVGTNNGISVIKDLTSLNNYAVGKSIKKVFVIKNGNLYYIADNKVNVFYSIHLNSIGKNSPQYSYTSAVPRPFTAPRILDGEINDIFVIPNESEYRQDGIERSSLIYVATTEGISLVHTNEITPTKSEKWGYSKHYSLITSSNNRVEFKVFDGTISNFRYIKVFDDLLIFILRENEGDVFYVYDRRSYIIRMMRMDTLPSRNVSSIGFHEN